MLGILNHVSLNSHKILPYLQEPMTYWGSNSAQAKVLTISTFCNSVASSLNEHSFYIYICNFKRNSILKTKLRVSTHLDSKPK